MPENTYFWAFFCLFLEKRVSVHSEKINIEIGEEIRGAGRGVGMSLDVPPCDWRHEIFDNLTLETISEGTECARTQEIKIKNFLSLITSSHLFQLDKNRAIRMVATSSIDFN